MNKHCCFIDVAASRNMANHFVLLKFKQLLEKIALHNIRNQNTLYNVQRGLLIICCSAHLDNE